MSNSITFKLSGDLSSKIGYYSSVFSKGYQISRSKYDASIRNWNIEYSDPYFMIEDSDKNLEFVFSNGKISNCTCQFFIRSESGTCMHIEAINSIDKKSISLIYKDLRKYKCVRFVDFNSTKVSFHGRPHPDFLYLPSCRIFDLWKDQSSLPYYDVSSISDWQPFVNYGISLYEYQKYSVQRMIHSRRSVLTLKMGLGKTICALAACQILDSKNILIVCPNNLKYQWKSEIDRFNMGDSIIIDKGSDISKIDNQRFCILSYEMLNRNVESFGRTFDVLIADEIQKIKNPDSLSWKSMSKLKSDFIFALSGTPVQNSISDILSIVSFLNPYEFAPQWKFWEEYCDFTKAKLLGLKRGKISNFRDKIYRYIINPKITNGSVKLPKVKESTIVSTMDVDSHRLHNGCMDMARPLLAKSFNYPLSFGEKIQLNALLSKARMAATDGRLVNPDSLKSNRFKSIENTILKIVSSGEKVVVYSEWIKSSMLLIDFLNKSLIRFSIFNGSLTPKKRDSEIRNFLHDSDVKVFLSTDSGGLGIDGLQLASNNIIHIEKMWNPAKIKQRNGRLVRNLQKKDIVNIFYFTCDSEIEKMIESSTFRKNDLVDDILS